MRCMPPKASARVQDKKPSNEFTNARNASAAHDTEPKPAKSAALKYSSDSGSSTGRFSTSAQHITSPPRISLDNPPPPAYPKPAQPPCAQWRQAAEEKPTADTTAPRRKQRHGHETPDRSQPEQQRRAVFGDQAAENRGRQRQRGQHHAAMADRHIAHADRREDRKTIDDAQRQQQQALDLRGIGPRRAGEPQDRQRRQRRQHRTEQADLHRTQRAGQDLGAGQRQRERGHRHQAQKIRLHFDRGGRPGKRLVHGISPLVSENFLVRGSTSSRAPKRTTTTKSSPSLSVSRVAFNWASAQVPIIEVVNTL